MRVLVTGATSGLGAQTVRAVAAAGHTPVCLGRDAARVREVAAEVGGEPCVVDLARLADVLAAARGLGRIDVVVLNAAVQHVRSTRETPDGLEETLAVNHLAQVALVDALLDSASPPARVVVVSSDTHDADRRTGTPPPLRAGVAELADAGRGEGSARTLGMRRYVTTKELLTAVALGLAGERPAVHVTAFNPGLMPGTGLDRDHPPVVRAVWGLAVRVMLVLPFTSTPRRSARALARLACEEPPPTPTGAYLDAGLRARPASRVASDPEHQRVVLADTRALIASVVARGSG